MHLGITPQQCRSAFAAGDIAFYNASGCTDSSGNDQLINKVNSNLNLKTYALIGVGVLATGLIIYFATKKKKS